jgi:hypothetical protein
MLIKAVDDDSFLALASAAAVALPIELTPQWTEFDSRVPGRSPWRRLAVYADGASDSPLALLALTRYEGRGFTYLWARHAPLWLTVPHGERPQADAELALRTALAQYLRTESPGDTFVRIDAWHRADDLQPLLQTTTYDRTVRIDLTQPADAYLAGLNKKFRYTVRQALARNEIAVAEEPELTREGFAELYDVYLETADRDGFGIYDASVYWSMIEALRPRSRVFVVRDVEHGSAEAPVIAWAIFTVYDGAVQYVYAAGNARARVTDATVRLLWEAAEVFRAEGARTMDLMGIDSDLAPNLAGVGVFKRKWGEPVEVCPAWDVPLKPAKYKALRLALTLKRLLRR